MPLQPSESRLFWWADLQPGRDSEEGEHPDTTRTRRITSKEEANLIGSLTDRGNHMPVIDIDRMNVRVVESSTPGNFHLYIDKPMTWEAYSNFLYAMWQAGIIEQGYYSASIDRRGTFVRKPGVKK